MTVYRSKEQKMQMHKGYQKGFRLGVSIGDQVEKKSDTSLCDTLNPLRFYTVIDYTLIGHNKNCEAIRINNPGFENRWYNTQFNFIVRKKKDMSYNNIPNNADIIIVNSSGNIVKTLQKSNVQSLTDDYVERNVSDLLIKNPLENYTVFTRGLTASYDRPPIVWK